MTVRRSEGGLTSIELAVTLLVSSVILVSLSALLVSQSRVERRVGSVADNEELLRQAMLALERDLRSAEPLLALPSSADNDLRVDLRVYPDVDAPAPETLTWRVDPATRELRRELWDGAGGVTTTYRLGGVVNTAGDPLFRYYKPNGDAFALGAVPAADIAGCTVRVRVNLAAAPQAGPGPSRLVSEVQLRNLQQRGAGCPRVPVSP